MFGKYEFEPKDIIADLRYGVLPYNDKALWGIKINKNSPDKHVRFLRLGNIKD